MLFCLEQHPQSLLVHEASSSGALAVTYLDEHIKHGCKQTRSMSPHWFNICHSYWQEQWWDLVKRPLSFSVNSDRPQTRVTGTQRSTASFATKEDHFTGPVVPLSTLNLYKDLDLLKALNTERPDRD